MHGSTLKKKKSEKKHRTEKQDADTKAKTEAICGGGILGNLYSFLFASLSHLNFLQ